MKNTIKPTSGMMKEVEKLLQSYLTDSKKLLKQGNLADAQERGAHVLRLAENGEWEMWYNLVQLLGYDEDVIYHDSFRQPIAALAKSWLPKFYKELGKREWWTEYEEKYLGMVRDENGEWLDD